MQVQRHQSHFKAQLLLLSCRKALSVAGLGQLPAVWPLDWDSRFREGPTVCLGCPTVGACRAWSPAQICAECFFCGRDFQGSRARGLRESLAGQKTEGLTAGCCVWGDF